MERVQAEPETVEIFENDIAMYLKMFCEEQGIESLKNESQNVWNGCLMYIQKNVFKDNKILKDNTLIHNDNNNIDSNYNRYNYKLIDDICDIYIYLCMEYDKEVSIMGFYMLTGITAATIHEWAKEKPGPSTAGFYIYKKLSEFREESLSAKLATGKQNPVGILAILNRHYQWNLPGVSKEKSDRIPQRTPEQIAQEYGQQPAELPPELPKS